MSDNHKSRRSLFNLPTELRYKIYALLLEDPWGPDNCVPSRSYQHDDDCCKWIFPDSLIICDPAQEGFISPQSPFNLLPRFAFASKRMLYDVARYMLGLTKSIRLKHNLVSCMHVADYFTNFLLEISTPDYNAFDHVYKLEFPNFDYYGYYSSTGDPNPSITLMMRCSSLREVSLTFLKSNLATTSGHNQQAVHTHRLLDDFLDCFDLRRLAECKSLTYVSLTGFLRRYTHGYPPDWMNTLEKFRAWLENEAGRDGRELRVHTCRWEN